MALKLKYFTVEEAEGLIPKVSEVMTSANETRHQIEEKVDHWRKVHKKMGEVDEVLLRGQIDFLAAHLDEQLGELTEMGCIPKNLDQGLVDFPARIGSKEGFLCWRFGEKKITHWHGLTEGFKGRKPLQQKE